MAITNDLASSQGGDRQASDVVIVGAGPTGLMAAALLTRCGLTVRILDKNESPAQESRAFGVQAKSLELFLNIGLAEEFLNRGQIVTGAQIFVDGRQAAELNLDDIGRTDTPYSFIMMVPQRETEAILIDDLRRFGIEVERRVEVTSFEQSGEGVVVHAKEKSGKDVEVRGAYLIGADGAHSIVRKTLKLSFEGAPYPQTFLLADCEIVWPLDYGHVKLFFRGHDFAICLPLRGKAVGRVIANEATKHSGTATARSAEATTAEPASLEEVQAALREASRVEVTLQNPSWVTRYRLHHRGVNRYGVGRVFVAGDAAHIHSPAGGQGMNTGLQDAANLAWKLALVHKGGAPAALLDTYHAERWPVGQKVLQYTDKVFTGATSQSGWVIGLRDRLLPVVAGTLSRSGLVRARAFHFVSQLGIHYDDNEFLRDDASPGTPREWREGLTAGHRAPNGLIARHRDVFDLTQGYRFRVLALSRKPLDGEAIRRLADGLAGLPKSIGLGVETHIIAQSLVGRDERVIRAESNEVFEAYGVTHRTPQGIFLIRPDGYIAYRADRLEVDGLKRFIQERFAQGTDTASQSG
ncbi:MAG: FAD-dependent monooxygenase [Verrucomicrobia bacterium]|nr:FAD-dependent monooxygenase [Verrucomicrobiota bacterium]